MPSNDSSSISIAVFAAVLLATACEGADGDEHELRTSNDALLARAPSRTHGDINGDRRSDIALTGGINNNTPWVTVPVAFSNGDGTFRVTNQSVTDFPSWATLPGAKPVAGDFNGDGTSDVALTGGLTGTTPWHTIPVAFSNRDGTFVVTNQTVIDFPTWATLRGATPVSGDFNGDGKDDVALTGGFSDNGQAWVTLPVAFSNGDGTFRVTNQSLAEFPGWATLPGAKPIAGDFNGDGKSDVALTGGLTGSTPWYTLPVAFSNGDGTFRVTNQSITEFGTWATQTGATPVGGDFNGDGRYDVALTGGLSGSAPWYTLPVAFSNGDGTFRVTNQPITEFGTWATQQNVKAVGGDFNGDGRADVALTGGFSSGAPWYTLPVAFSRGDGTFRVTNQRLADFPTWATHRGATPVGIH